MRFAAVFATALLLSGCTWMRQELEPPAPVAAPSAAPAIVKPEPPRPVKPRPRVERAIAPVVVPQAPPQPQTAPPAPPPIDYGARCHAMAANRADDARQLGASTADQARMASDVYRDCMQQSVK